MATLVQGPLSNSNTSAAATIARQYAAALTPGSTLIAIVRLANQSNAADYPITVADDANGSWTQAVEAPVLTGDGADSNIEIFYCVNSSSSAATVTATWGSAIGRRKITIYEVTGLHATTPLEDTATASGTSTAIGTGTVTLAGTGFVLAACLTGTATGTMTADSPYTDDTEAAFWSWQGIGRRIVSASGDQSPAFTQSSSQAWVGISAAFKDAGGGGSATITADQGSYSLTGQDSGLRATRVLTADFGSYALTGQVVTLQKDTPGQFILQVDAGSYSWTGQEALADYAMNADVGNFTLAGQEVTFTQGYPQAYSISVNAGSYTFKGQNTRLDWSGAPIVPNRQIGIYMGMRIGL